MKKLQKIRISSWFNIRRSIFDIRPRFDRASLHDIIIRLSNAEIGDIVQVEGASIFDLGLVGEMFR